MVSAGELGGKPWARTAKAILWYTRRLKSSEVLKGRKDGDVSIATRTTQQSKTALPTERKYYMQLNKIRCYCGWTYAIKNIAIKVQLT